MVDDTLRDQVAKAVCSIAIGSERVETVMEIIQEHTADLTNRLDRYRRLDVIHMQNTLRMIQAIGAALGIDQNDADACVPGCDEGAGGLEHDLHHLIDRDVERGAVIERVRTLANTVENRMMATAKPSEIRAALDGTETP